MSARSLRARIAKFCVLFGTKANSSKVRAKCKTADIKVLAKKARTKRGECTAHIDEFKQNNWKLKGKLDFFTLPIHPVSSQYFASMHFP